MTLEEAREAIKRGEEVQIDKELAVDWLNRAIEEKNARMRAREALDIRIGEMRLADIDLGSESEKELYVRHAKALADALGYETKVREHDDEYDEVAFKYGDYKVFSLEDRRATA